MNVSSIAKKIILPIASVVLFIPCFFLNAYEIVNTSAEISGDFVLEPAKLEITLDPGAVTTETLNILNRTDKTLDFKIEIEDFSGSKDPSQTVILKGAERGPYSLKDYLTPEIIAFSLEPGQRIILPVVINIPHDAEPGGLYGSVLVSSQSGAQGGVGTTVISRLGALFFVNVNGEVIKDGELTSFKKIDSETGKTSFELLFANNGSVHLNPFGSIKIFNLVGTQIDEVEVPVYFAMPDSVRYRKIDWERGKLFGRYKAIASINRGYGDMTDELSLTFWALSAKTMLTILGGLILLILIIIWLVRTFDFNIVREKRKQDEEELIEKPDENQNSEQNKLN